DRSLGAQLRGVPRLASDRREGRRVLASSDILLDEVEAGHGNEDPRAPGVLEDHELLVLLPLDSDEAADAVLDVDDDVALLDFEERVDRSRVGGARGAAEPVTVEELVVGDVDALLVLEDESVVEPSPADLDVGLDELAE